MQATMNLKVKFRESFRPLRLRCWQPGSGPLDNADDLVLTVSAGGKHRRAAPPSTPQGSIVSAIRSTFRGDAIDYSARVQTVDAQHGRPASCCRTSPRAPMSVL
jgi:predicted NodU family carbamoyl transferase